MSFGGMSVGEMSFRGEFSFWENYPLGNCPSGNCPSGNVFGELSVEEKFFGKKLVGEMSVGELFGFQLLRSYASYFCFEKKNKDSAKTLFL